MKPNLFIIGASKCGTTFLHDVLNAHPAIYMSEPKELHYFTQSEWHKKTDWYESFFYDSSSHTYQGESSPIYSETTYFPEVPGRLYSYNPSAKLIYLVRSPNDRIKSVYRQALSTGHWHQKKYYDKIMPRDYSEAVFNYPPFVEATRYCTHVQNYLRFFPDEALKVILFEDLVRDTPSTISEIFSFLGVNKNVSIDLESAEKNTGEGKAVFNPWPSRFKKLIPNIVIRSLPDGVKRIAQNSVQALPVPNFPPPKLSVADESRLCEILTPEVEGIYHYLGIKDDPWQFFKTPLKGSGLAAKASTCG